MKPFDDGQTPGKQDKRRDASRHELAQVSERAACQGDDAEANADGTADDRECDRHSLTRGQDRRSHDIVKNVRKERMNRSDRDTPCSTAVCDRFAG